MPAETPYLTSCRKRAVCGDWMVVCAVRYEPVSIRVILEKNTEAAVKNVKKTCGTGVSGILRQFDIREEQGACF